VNFECNPNVASTETVPVLIAGNGVVLARFGIHRNGPNGKPRPPLLNARTDGMRKGQFRTHLKKQRCVIPADGFYEWRDEGGKQPYYFAREDGKPLTLAGIWQEAEYKGDKRAAFAILTEEPNELVASYHDRMPLALADDKVALWLDLSQESPPDQNLLLDLTEFTVRPMDRAMNNVRQKNLAAIDPEAEAA
jgi:putative SOS response-associated peptidase YedK